MNAHVDVEQKERKPRSTKRGGWFITDAELIELLGVPEKDARIAIEGYDNHPEKGFPQKQALWGNRRFRQAVEDYLRFHYGYRLEGLNRRVNP